MKKTGNHKGKLIVAIIAALSLTLMLLPTTAFASDHTNEDYVQFIQADAGQTVTQDIGDVTSEDKCGVWVDANKDGTATVTAGNITTAGEAVKATSSDQARTVVNAGNVEATGEAEFGAVVSAWDPDSSSTLNVGDVKADLGINVRSMGGVAYLDAGDVNAFGTENNNFTNNSINADDGGSAIAVLGDVQSGATGIDLDASTWGSGEEISRASVEASSIIAAGTGLRIGSSGQGLSLAGINGDITAGGSGIYTQTRDAASIIDAQVNGGNVTAGGDALRIINMGGQTIITVNGSAESTGGNGLLYVGYGASHKGQVLVTDTLSGATSGVQLSGGADKLDLTVWEIKAGTGNIISGDDADGTFAKSVHYIVRTEQPTEGVTVYATKADGSPLDKKYADEHGEGGYEVASEGDTILLKFDVQPGYSVNGAYNGTTPLQTDASGNYYIQVARGGGIYLSVDVAIDSDGGDYDGGGAIDGGGSGKPANKPANKPSNVPQTGDNNTSALWITLFAVSFLAALALVIRRFAKR